MVQLDDALRLHLQHCRLFFEMGYRGPSRPFSHGRSPGGPPYDVWHPSAILLVGSRAAQSASGPVDDQVPPRVASRVVAPGVAGESTGSSRSHRSRSPG